MFKIPGIPISKEFKKAEIQDITHYGDFAEQTNFYLKKDRFGLISKEAFDQKAKEERRRKNYLPILKLFIAIIIPGSLLVVIPTPFSKADGTKVLIVFVVLLVLFLVAYLSYNKYKYAPDSSHSLKPTDSPEGSDKAKSLLKWAQNTIANNQPLFIKDDASGEIFKLTDVLQKSRNKVMVLLGDETHRQSLSVNGRIPNGSILYLKDDEEKIFQPLKDAIAKTLNDNYPTEIESSIQKDTESPSKASTQIKSDTTPSGRKKDPEHDFRYFKTTLLDTVMCKVVVERMDEPEFLNAEIKGKGYGTRERWFNTLSIISKNPKQWISLRDNPHGKENLEFKKELFGVNGLNSNNTNEQLKFRTGENKYLNALIKLTGVIPEDKLVSKDKKIK